MAGFIRLENNIFNLSAIRNIEYIPPKGLEQNHLIRIFYKGSTNKNEENVDFTTWKTTDKEIAEEIFNRIRGRLL